MSELAWNLHETKQEGPFNFLLTTPEGARAEVSSIDSESAYLDWISTPNSSRRRGLATQLARVAAQEILRRGGKEFHITFVAPESVGVIDKAFGEENVVYPQRINGVDVRLPITPDQVCSTLARIEEMPDNTNHLFVKAVVNLQDPAVLSHIQK